MRSQVYSVLYRVVKDCSPKMQRKHQAGLYGTTLSGRLLSWMDGLQLFQDAEETNTSGRKEERKIGGNGIRI